MADRRSARPRGTHGAEDAGAEALRGRHLLLRLAPRRGNPSEAGAGRYARKSSEADNRRPTWLILPVAYACLKD